MALSNQLNCFFYYNKSQSHNANVLLSSQQQHGCFSASSGSGQLEAACLVRGCKLRSMKLRIIQRNSLWSRDAEDCR